MVLSSQTTKVTTSHRDRTDVAACWGNLAGAAATGAGGCDSLLLPNPDWSVGRHGNGFHGDMDNPASSEIWEGGSGGSNSNLTGGRQHAGMHGSSSMSSNGVMLSDDQHTKGVVVLQGLSFADRRIAQASHGEKYSRFGVPGRFIDRQSRWSEPGRDTPGPSRDVDNMCKGKPRVRNICAAKGGLPTDCKARDTWMLIGPTSVADASRRVANVGNCQPRIHGPVGWGYRRLRFTAKGVGTLATWSLDLWSINPQNLEVATDNGSGDD